jgi:hypothetical protein
MSEQLSSTPSIIDRVPTDEELERMYAAPSSPAGVAPIPQENHASLAPSYEAAVSANGEFQLGDTKYRCLGRTSNGMEFNSTTQDGTTRTFVVYRSNSGGAYRVSQGFETYYDANGQPKPRFMKGPELSPYAQYTQDTQLHPDFDKAFGRLEEDKRIASLPVQPIPNFDADRATDAIKDFENQTTVYTLGNERVHHHLSSLKAGMLAAGDMLEITGVDAVKYPGDASRAYMARIDALNKELEAAGIMPDFSAPPDAVEADGHPQLGAIVRETYRKDVNGVQYEWQMAHDMHGRVWIDRIRLQGAEPSAYGTDKQMVFSGILTSKPLDYTSQTTGLAPELKQDLGNGLTDLAPFLRKLLPIQQYAQHYAERTSYASTIQTHQ